jgi:hypothetical protein
VARHRRFLGKATIFGVFQEYTLAVHVRFILQDLMKNQALQYYMHDGSTAFRFELV